MNASELWKQAEADSRDVVELFASPIVDERDKVFAILVKLRSAMSAMQSLDVKVRDHGRS